MKRPKRLLLILGTFIFINISAPFAQATAPDESVLVIAAQAPSYPAGARAARIKGDVIIEVKFDASGKVTSAEAISGHKPLFEVCIRAAKQWQFSPANKSGISRKARLTFSFRDMERDEKESEIIIRFLPPYKVEVIWNRPPVKYMGRR